MEQLNRLSTKWHAPRASRKLKVYYAYTNNQLGRNFNYPVIRLAGKYLRTFGFEIGTHVQVDLTDSQIVIRKITA